MQCPKCGYKLQPFDNACPRCARLARTQAVSAAPSPYPAGAATHGVKLCATCGQPSVAHATQCGRCGSPFPALPASTAAAPPFGTPGPPPVPGRAASGVSAWERRAAWGLAAAVLLIAVVCAAFQPWKHRDEAAGNLLIVGGGSGSGGVLGRQAVDSGSIAQRLTDAHATTGGDVEVSLAWNTLTDLDLSVRDPSGELISALHRHSRSGGEQDVDANPTPLTPEGEIRYQQGLPPGQENVLPVPEFMVDLDKKLGLPGGLSSLPGFGGTDDHAPSLYTRSPVEHIFFAHAPAGIYVVYAHVFSWREPTRDPLPFTIQVRTHGRVFYATTRTIGPGSYCADGAPDVQVCEFLVK